MSASFLVTILHAILTVCNVVRTHQESKEVMREFFRGEAHATAMKSMKDVSRYAKVHGYFTDTVPVSVEDAILEWRTNGRRVYGEPMEAYGDCVEEPCPEPF